jgi:diketogulonate reductase-like aldo/keto reductase
MLARAFGAGFPSVPVIGQGTWNVPLRGGARDEAIRALRAGVDLGMVHIDTAEMYGDGGAESLVGEAIAGLPREQLFLVSKVLPSNASYKGTIAACHASMKRMGVDYLDCYLLHWRGSVPLSETMRALEQLVADGSIRSLGVSNFDVDDLREAQAVLKREKIACNQVLYHLDERTIEAHETAFCRDAGIAIVAYTPFGRGDWRDTPGAKELERIAKAHGVTAHAVILAVLTRDELTFAIPKAATLAHVGENAAAGEFRLTADEIAAIDRAFPVRKRRGGLPTL